MSGHFQRQWMSAKSYLIVFTSNFEDHGRLFGGKEQGDEIKR